ncbi:hypothetical protein [Nonomuraea sp. NPDC049400]|uniref:hypothetical protein n=1 Tax=Nonomuraea sp. NPDC049400 TaxID=3364352 RepID=UPI00378E4632
MTLQGVGFTDEVNEETPNMIAAAVSERVAEIGSVQVTLGPPSWTLKASASLSVP